MTQAMLTFIEDQEGIFTTEVTDQNRSCLTERTEFAANFIMNNGKQTSTSVKRTLFWDEDFSAMLHFLDAPEFRFYLYVTVAGELIGSLKQLTYADDVLPFYSPEEYKRRSSEKPEYIELMDQNGDILPELVPQLLTIIEDQDGNLSVTITEENRRCLTHRSIFPATFILADGRKFAKWLYHTYQFRYNKQILIHQFNAPNFDFEIQVTTDGKFSVVNDSPHLLQGNDPVTFWSKDGTDAYYYDRFGSRHYVNIYNHDTGEEIPSIPGTCRSCTYEFPMSHEFVDGQCEACDDYEKGNKEKPVLDSFNVTWDVPDIRELLKKK
jgi:hypothetical protein